MVAGEYCCSPRKVRNDRMRSALAWVMSWVIVEAGVIEPATGRSRGAVLSRLEGLTLLLVVGLDVVFVAQELDVLAQVGAVAASGVGAEVALVGEVRGKRLNQCQRGLILGLHAALLRLTDSVPPRRHICPGSTRSLLSGFIRPVCCHSSKHDQKLRRNSRLFPGW
jgi:hypothetical protein